MYELFSTYYKTTIMSIGLNTFLLEEVESFPDDPYPTIDFIKVNEKLTLLELRLVYGDDVTIDARTRRLKR